MQAEVVRREVIEDLQRRFRLDVDVILYAHADLRAVSDPVIPDSLPTTRRPELRAELEAALREGLARVARAPADPPGAAVAENARSGFTTLSPVGVPGAAPQRIRTRVLERILGRAPGLARAAALRLVWRALTRYHYLGLRSTLSAATPADIYLKYLQYGAVEGFASIFNCSMPTYYGLFPDLEAPFGCAGNFFALRGGEAPRMLLCNPPYLSFILNAFVIKALNLLDEGEITVLCVLPAFETADRGALNLSGRCAAQYPVDYLTDVDTSLLKASRYSRWCGLYCKERFSFVETNRDTAAALTSVLVLVLSSQTRMTPTVATIVEGLPPRDVPCSEGARAAASYLSLASAPPAV